MNGKPYLMERAGERMFVPPEKVQAFEKYGWKVIEPPAEVAPEAAKPVESPVEAVTTEATVEKTGKRPRKSK